MPSLTNRKIQATKPADKDVFLNDGAGLYLRIRPSGLKSWLYRYKVGTTARWLDMGGYPATGLADARIEAGKAANLRKQNIDPVEKRKQDDIAKAEAKAAQALADEGKAALLTVGDLLDRWQRTDLQTRKDKGAEVRRSFEKDVLPVLGSVAAEDVTRKMVAAILDTVVERGAPIIARNLLGDLRQMFTFAVRRDLIDSDPTALLKRNDYGIKAERDRVLNETEIKELVAKLPTAKLQNTTEYAVWLMLSTCCRVGEISRARWDEIDLENATWFIPADNAKNGKPHTIHLSGFSTEYFTRLKAITGNAPWCFPAENKDDSHVCLKSISKQVRDRQRLEPMKNRSKATASLLLSGGTWTPHDLRRTGATIMGMLGVRPDVIEKCLNHVEQNKLIRIYQRQELKEQQREAWQLLGQRLAIVTSDESNVISFSRNVA